MILLLYHAVLATKGFNIKIITVVAAGEVNQQTFYILLVVTSLVIVY